MAGSIGGVSERWYVVLIVVERDGSMDLVVVPTRQAVPCPQCGELSRRQHSRYERHPLDLPWRGQRPPLGGVGLSAVGYALAALSAWLGGELVYVFGTGISRNAFEPASPEFQIAADAAALKEGVLSAAHIRVEEQDVSLVLLRRGDEVLALSGICSHSGGPLAEGKLVEDECVECPWHRSRFSLRDGSVHQGPASAPQPVFEARMRMERSRCAG